MHESSDNSLKHLVGHTSTNFIIYSHAKTGVQFWSYSSDSWKRTYVLPCAEIDHGSANMHPVYNFIANVLRKIRNKKQAQWGELAEDKAHDIDFPQPSKITVSSELLVQLLYWQYSIVWQGMAL